MLKSDGQASQYRCPNVPADIPADVAWCNYTDCRGCTSQRRIRTEHLPDPTSYFDERDLEDRVVDASFEDDRGERAVHFDSSAIATSDSAFDSGRSPS